MRSVVTVAAVTALAPLLAACFTVTVPPRTQPLDLALTRPCPSEPEISAEAERTGLGEMETRRLLGWYITNYPWCATTKSAVVEIIERRDARIAGR
jgi:hypothetical protein